MNVVDTLSKLVGYPTVSDRPVTELAAFLAERHEGRGFRVERFGVGEPGKFNLIASAGPAEDEALVLSGHMDVVPTEGQPWSTDPFSVTERDGRLYGRGTSDMKGFVAATLHALDRIDSAELRRGVVLVWTHDEEVGCLGSAQLADTLQRRGRRLPDACLIGEPTDFHILRAHPGHVAMEIAFTGKAAHSSRPDLGQNAIEAAAEAIAMVREIARELEHERAHEDLLDRPWVAVNVARIRGGSAINIVPDACLVEIGYRPLPGMPAEAVFDRIVARMAERWGDRARPRLQRVTPSLLTRDGTPLQRLLEPHAAAPGCGAATFATDGGNLARLGCEPLVFGPGSIEVAHKADEYVAAEALHRAVDVVEAVIRRRCC